MGVLINNKKYINMSEYLVTIKASVLSNLSSDELGKQLVIALHSIENWYSKFDNTDENLEVIDYIETIVQEICPRCNIPLECRIIDRDGTNLQECSICIDCWYWMPSLR